MLIVSRAKMVMVPLHVQFDLQELYNRKLNSQTTNKKHITMTTGRDDNVMSVRVD